MDHQKNLDVELNNAHSLSLLIFLVEIIIYAYRYYLCMQDKRDTREKID